MDHESDVTKNEVTVDYYSRLPGPCGDCCLKFPCPSVIACAMMIVGDILLLAGFHLGAEEAKYLFAGTPITEAFNVWFTDVQIIIYCVSVFMFIIAIVLLAISCLGTGSTRSVYLCRFKTRRSGRCQTAVFILIAYFLVFCWVTAICFAVVPVFFMFVMNRGVCLGVEMEQQTCLNLVQWALLSPDTPVGLGKELVCDDKMRNICQSNMMLLFSLAFLGCLLILLASVQFVVSMSANFAQLLDRYKRAYMSDTAGSYNMRSGVRNIMRGSKRNDTGHTRAGARTNVALTRYGAGNGAYTGNGKSEESEADQRYSSLEMTSFRRQEEPPPPNPPPYIPSTREPLSNLQHRARSYDPLDYNDYNTGQLNTSRVKNMSRSAEPIDFGGQYDRYDRYNEYDV
ncbi:neuronal membrane glycoprotein M6-b-like [Acanthaster planci]|uniref:Neuronal membrane glycoprotein M6-b-like n=1 Tax=Acanthaster planci TaxID=133434 RepID=A0A8B7ZIE7_ACAPL|nr:neuronal membrane glycoprotein M6-b-like [Acanthaster planci]